MNEKLEKNLENISDIFAKFKNKEDLKNFLEDILTPQEIIEISDRIEIIKLLKQWKTQREIAEDLKISVTTVNRGSRIIKFWKWSDRFIL